jgi:hypothetical protein
LMCPVCERPYRSGTIACDLGTHDEWLARLVSNALPFQTRFCRCAMPASVLAPGADPNDPEVPRIALELRTVIRIDVDEEVSCEACPQRFIGVYPMLQHYARDHRFLDPKGWSACGR